IIPRTLARPLESGERLPFQLLNTDRQKAVFLFKETDLSIAPGAAGQRRRHRAGKNRKTEISAR
ncbi:hypothetical protein, partial [Citrobacter portucalensis]|uniref:hypothetical protein n=1 Tax=Citrobacter portucalensis TaxID=1639133 RepID=UPI00396B2D40